MIMQYVFGMIIFLFGAALGSFVAVIVSRYNTGLPFLKRRSFCFSCNTQLQKKDLFPIFSFLFLGGRCRYCDSRVPKENLVIEIVMGILSVLAALKSGFFIFDFSLPLAGGYLLLLFIFAAILAISIYDLKHFIIPDSFLISFFVLSFFYNLYFIIINSLSFSAVIYNFAAGAILAVPFLLIFIISKGTWFGLGDVKYIFVLGIFLGFVQGLPAVILAFWIGAVFSVLAILVKKLKPQISLPLFKNNLTIKSEIPFGPFISAGIIISFYFNADLLQIQTLFNFFR
jgi:leader peptidase (prepilin peptidase) / N-methyltransferase